jgi:hypothetical protein
MKSKIIFMLHTLNQQPGRDDNLELPSFILPSVLLPTKRSNKCPLVCLVCPGTLRSGEQGPTFVIRLTENTNHSNSYPSVILGTFKPAGKCIKLLVQSNFSVQEKRFCQHISEHIDKKKTGQWIMSKRSIIVTYVE